MRGPDGQVGDAVVIDVAGAAALPAEALARLEPVPLETAGEFPAMRKGDLRWFVS